MTRFHEFDKSISLAMHSDQFILRRSLRGLRDAEKSGKPFDRALEKFTRLLTKSCEQRESRVKLIPPLTWDEQLPVCERRAEIADAIRDNQVVIVCGETGSGKSTQLPKIALELGRGVGGIIGHTQPRRIAARSIAARLAEELRCPLGQQVGYRIRFQDATGPNTLIRLMTDGIMLAETQADRFLDQYDTIIVDEAHERSLNIDFLLGYLKRLLPKRPDLRVIITSATIDAERFSDHFSSHGRPAPVMMVSGRTYPVEIRWRPLDSSDSNTESRSRNQPNDSAPEPRDWLDGVSDAVDELTEIDSGHILVFLPTERDIREAERRLSGRRYPGDSPKHATEIVPLYGKLSSGDQDKVFRACSHRRIVLATNVAESSLTVPGIRYVVDTGTARISRYSARSRMQRLPIEPISRASANQRAGRCGRVAPGVCIRLYSADDFAQREDFTAPEIQRTNLAQVILRTVSLQLGDIQEFPFLDPPKPTTVREGYRTLEELGALDADGRLTQIGKQMSRLPVDPRISRMILAAIDEHAVPEVLAIASALEIQDPRERPIEKQQAADEAHAQFKHRDSDFMTLLNLWDTWHERSHKLSGGQLRKWCQQNFLSWLRMREWVDVHRQLRELLSESDDDLMRKAGSLHPVNDRKNDFAAIHRALMTGLLANIAFQNVEGDYTGAGGNRLTLWPGSALHPKGPKWLVAAELVETSRRYARTVARIQPEWIEPLASHLISRDYFEPHWDPEAGNVMVFEKVSLWGMPIVPRRKITLARVNPAKSREMLIQHGLVEFGLLHGATDDEDSSDYDEEEAFLRRGQKARVRPGQAAPKSGSGTGGGNSGSKGRRPGGKGWGSDFPFLRHNHEILQQLREVQAKTRHHHLLPEDDVQFEFYASQIPEECVDRDRLRRWYHRISTRDNKLLQFDLNQFSDEAQRTEHARLFPESAQFGMMHLPLAYQLDPGSEADGVTVTVPQEGVGQLSESRLEWLVPGLLEQKVLALIRSLPKTLRTHFVPAPETATKVTAELDFGRGDLLTSLAARLSIFSGQKIDPREFDVSSLPDHLRFNIRIVDDDRKTVLEGRSLKDVRNQLLAQAQALLQAGSSAVGSSQPGSRTAATPAIAPEEQQWQRKGFMAWDFFDVPESIDIRRAGLVLKSFPSVHDDVTSVSLMLCQDPREATRELRTGLRRLIYLMEKKRLSSQVEHLPQVSQLRLLSSSIRGLEFVHHLALLMADRAYLGDQPLPRTRAAFDQTLKFGRNRVGLVAQEFVQLMPRLLEQYHEIRRALEKAKGPGWEFLLEDMKLQLGGLVHSTFLIDTPWPWLIQFPRYFQAIGVRLQRLTSGGLKTETSLARDFQPYLARYEQRLKDHQKTGRRDPMLEHFRWMLEEFRVSLFAQKLGTAISVSPTKLDEHWNKIE
ncbi:MAG: ATP-dependent RNA helicase HrpA [Planctomyces sp.]|nr:ATP-dependent RNA helicase HrpA [Planctomyces sp.]